MTQSVKRTPKVSLVVVNWNGRDLLKRAVESLLTTDYPNFELLVVDNCSSDGSLKYLSGVANIRVILSQSNVGYPGGCNLGISASSGEYLVLLNNDVEVTPGWLSALINAMEEDTDIGIAAGTLLYPDRRTIQHAGGALSYPLAIASHIGCGEVDLVNFSHIREVDYVTGTAIAVRRSVLTEIGGYDEKFFPSYYEDVDLCKRCQLIGFKVVYVPDSIVIHNESATMRRMNQLRLCAIQKNRYRYIIKHYSESQFFEEFLPAETGAIPAITSIDALMATERACEAIKLRTMEWLPATTSPQSIDRYREAFGKLQELLTLELHLRGDTSRIDSTLINPIYQSIESTNRELAKQFSLLDWDTDLGKLKKYPQLQQLIEKQHAFNYSVVQAIDQQSIFLKALAELRMESAVPELPLMKSDQDELESLTKHAYSTIIAKNYLAHARTFAKSCRQFHPNCAVYVLVVDDYDQFFDPTAEAFTVINLNELKIPNLPEMLLRYSVLELCTAVKPYFLEFLLRKFELTSLCYFDPDIVLYRKPDQIWNALKKCNVLLTPHLLDGSGAGRESSEINILQSGCYNLGFIGVSATPESFRFLLWWQKRLDRHCLADPSRGLFVDQRWVDLAPGLFQGITTLRDPGCNVSYWNLIEREINQDSEQLLFSGSPLTFYHFSGYSPADPKTLSRHRLELRFNDYPKLRSLYDSYREQLIEHGYDAVSSWEYGNDFCKALPFPIPTAARVRWRDWEESHRPFGAGSNDQLLKRFVDWLNLPVEPRSSLRPVLTNLGLALYQSHLDLQQRFPRLRNQDRGRYLKWLISKGEKRFGLTEQFLIPMQRPTRDRAIELLSLKSRFYHSTVDLLFKLGIGTFLLRKIKHTTVMKVHRFFNPLSQRQRSEPEHNQSAAIDHRSSAVDGLNVVGYLKDETGIGEGARSLIRALKSRNYPVSGWEVTSTPYRQKDRSVEYLADGRLFPVTCHYVNADQAQATFNELGQEFFDSRYNIGFWHWELSEFPKDLKGSFSFYDEIWVGSNFIKQALLSHTTVPVHVIGHHITERPVSSFGRSDFGIREDSFAVLFAFDCLSEIERKNPFGAIEAFRKAFANTSDKVTLIIKACNLREFPLARTRIIDELKALSGILIEEYLDREELTGLFQSSDCYLSLHRSEGFGLTIAEAMSNGIPVVATNYSGNTDFMNHTNSFPVNFQLCELNRDFGRYQRGACWAEPNLDHAALQLRLVFSDRARSKRIGELGAKDIASICGELAFSSRVIDRLREIASCSPMNRRLSAVGY